MSEHSFHPVFEGCTKCAALPDEGIECVPPETGGSRMTTRARFDVREDGGEFVAEWDGQEFRSGNPFGLDSKLSDAGAPFPRDLYLVPWKVVE